MKYRKKKTAFQPAREFILSLRRTDNDGEALSCQALLSPAALVTIWCQHTFCLMNFFFVLVQ